MKFFNFPFFKLSWKTLFYSVIYFQVTTSHLARRSLATNICPKNRSTPHYRRSSEGRKRERINLTIHKNHLKGRRSYEHKPRPSFYLVSVLIFQRYLENSTHFSHLFFRPLADLQPPKEAWQTVIYRTLSTHPCFQESDHIAISLNIQSQHPF